VWVATHNSDVGYSDEVDRDKDVKFWLAVVLPFEETTTFQHAGWVPVPTSCTNTTSAERQRVWKNWLTTCLLVLDWRSNEIARHQGSVTTMLRTFFMNGNCCDVVGEQCLKIVDIEFLKVPKDEMRPVSGWTMFTSTARVIWLVDIRMMATMYSLNESLIVFISAHDKVARTRRPRAWGYGRGSHKSTFIVVRVDDWIIQVVLEVEICELSAGTETTAVYLKCTEKCKRLGENFAFCWIISRRKCSGRSDEFVDACTVGVWMGSIGECISVGGACLQALT
jgi:hypothetical protein